MQNSKDKIKKEINKIKTKYIKNKDKNTKKNKGKKTKEKTKILWDFNISATLGAYKVIYVTTLTLGHKYKIYTFVVMKVVLGSDFSTWEVWSMKCVHMISRDGDPSEGWGVGVNCRLEPLQKFIRFGSVTRPLDWYDY